MVYCYFKRIAEFHWPTFYLDFLVSTIINISYLLLSLSGLGVRFLFICVGTYMYIYLNNRNLFFTVLEAGKSNIKETSQFSFLLRTLLLVIRWLCSHM